MVIGAFPIAKLGALLLKQLSKPIATGVKERAKTHPFFRKYICMPPAHFYNWCEIRMRMWLLNLGKPVNVPPMNEAMAIELGANLLGETIIFGIAAGILLFEYSRQSANNERKEADLKSRLSYLEKSLQELALEEENHRAQITDLTRRVYDIDTRVVKMPFSITSSKPKEGTPSPVNQSNIHSTSTSIIGDAISYIQESVYNHDNDAESQSRLI